MKKKTQRKKQFTLMLVLFMLVESLLSTSLVYDVQALPQNDEVTEQTVTKTQENPAGEQIDTGAAGTEENGQATDSSDTQQSQVSDGAQNTSDLPEEETDENGGISAPTDESQQTTPSNEDEQPADQQQTTEDEDEASSDDAAGEEQSQEQTDENDSELTPEQKAEETEEDETKIGDLLAEDPSFVITENNLTLQIGDEKQLYAKENGQNVTPQWESSNSQVATVSATGVVTAVAKGSAVISAAINGKKAECLVTVIEKTTSNTVRYSVLILDATHSMKGTALTREKQAAQKFCKTILAADGKNYIAVVVMQAKKRELSAI